jgi:hypothetical protein
VRALVIEKRVQNLVRLTTCSSYSYSWNRHTAHSGFWRPQLPLILKSGRRRG